MVLYPWCGLFPSVALDHAAKTLLSEYERVSQLWVQMYDVEQNAYQEV